MNKRTSNSSTGLGEAQEWGTVRDQDEEGIAPEHKGFGARVNTSRLRKAMGFIENS